MNNKAPTTNTLSFFDVISNEWVTVITIRHPAESSSAATPLATPSFLTKEPSVTSPLKQDLSNLKGPKTNACQPEDYFSLKNLKLPEVFPDVTWNK